VKLFLLALFLVGCSITVDPIECTFDYDCNRNSICNNGICLTTFNNSDDITLECGCWGYSPNITTNYYCSSGHDVVVYCNWYCRNGDLSYSKVCY
jgi:hypothetical protein